jgi:hypothetical protein
MPLPPVVGMELGWPSALYLQTPGLAQLADRPVPSHIASAMLENVSPIVQMGVRFSKSPLQSAVVSVRVRRGG